MEDIKLTRREHIRVLGYCSFLGEERASALSILHFIKLHRRRLTNDIIERVAMGIGYNDKLKAVSSKYIEDYILYTAEFKNKNLSWEIK